MSKEKQGGSLYRAPISDQQAIQAKLGGFIHFLQMNGIPTPSTAENRILLFSILYSEFKMQVQQHQQKEMENIQSNLPRVKQALQELDEREKVAAEAVKKAEEAKAAEAEEEKVDGEKEAQ